MENLIMVNGPHLHHKDSSRRIMLDVILALLPATAASVVIFGLRAAVVLVSCILGAVAAEFLFNLLTRRPQTVGDLSAVVTGLLLALNLSTAVAAWQCVVGAVFSIVLVKCAFGGLGRNFANPAITGRVFMLLAFSSVAGGAAPALVELQASATPLEELAGGALPSVNLLDMFLGLRGGAIGETCIAALLLGFVYLVLRGVIKWYVPCAFIATVFVCFLAVSGDVTRALYEIMAGGLVLGAVFMATDYVTTPITNRGKVVFAVCCGLITFIIRHYCAYPEGVSFSILIMNILTPFVEKLTANKPLEGRKHA